MSSSDSIPVTVETRTTITSPSGGSTSVVLVQPPVIKHSDTPLICDVVNELKCDVCACRCPWNVIRVKKYESLCYLY